MTLLRGIAIRKQNKQRPKKPTVTLGTIPFPLKIICNFSPSQKEALRAFATNDIVFILGSAGTGKTQTALGAAIAFAMKREGRITVSRPAVEAAGESLGFLPGDSDCKLEPFVAPLKQCLPRLVNDPKQALAMMDILPIAFMRGCTVDTVLILDEAQNATFQQILLAITRIGRGAKIVLTGDFAQVDIPDSGLAKMIGLVRSVPGVAVVTLSDSDQQRNPIVNRILAAVG